jgi:hypothetical protein
MGNASNKEPAFPRSHHHDGHNGMSLRDYFAAHLMTAVMARYPDGHEYGWQGLAEIAYAAADAMMTARDPSKQSQQVS